MALGGMGLVCAGDLRPGDDGQHAFQRLGPAGIDLLDARVREDASQDRDVGAIHVEIVDVGGLALDELGVLVPANRFSKPVPCDE